MERATISRIESWDALTVPGGYAGLSDLAEDGFTGAVEAAGTRMFMLNGRVIGVFDGTISAFDGAESTAYEAPDPALPLLFAMQERGGEVRGKYYTDDTPLREVDETLTEGGFTGYLELSENVLSGDYYVAYYGGRSLAAAFIGNEGRVVTGREAFDLAADEVGIYEVRAVDIEVSELPEPSTDEVPAATGAVEEATPDEDPAEAETDAEELEPEPDEPAEAAEAAESDAPDEAASEEPVDEEPGDADAPSESPDEADVDEPAIPDAEGEPPESPAAEPTGPDDSSPVDEAEPAGGPGDTATTPSTSDSTASEASGSGRAASPGRGAGADLGRPVATEDRPERDDPDARFREEERWREARTVPALDPDESAPPGAEREAASQVSVDPPEPRAAPSGADEAELQALYDRVDELETELESTNRERRKQSERVEKLIEERDELLDERESLETRIEELEAKVEEQASRIEGQERELAEAASGGSGRDTAGTAATNSVDPQTALDQTDLFVRYGSKGKATLQTAHDGRASKEDVSDNLRLETHSRFDPAGTTVSGRPFDDYLADTIEYRFISWLVEELLYEIQDTGSEKALRALYDALPRIDRAEFNGTVSGVDEEGEDSQETFDVVCRDRMGKPLVVANINDSLDPATGEMMGSLVEDATGAGEAHESLGAAFFVTASFFEPDALETASEATGGGFLSRDSKKSFVKLSRKGGYHLSLVEARGGEFHVAVPEF